MVDNNSGYEGFDFGETLSKTMLGETDAEDSARADFKVFAPQVLVNDDDGHLIQLQPFQIQVINTIEKKAETTLIVLPRGFAKSSLVTKGYAAFKIGNNRNIRIIVASNTDDQAIEQVSGVGEVLNTRRYIEVFGDMVPKSKSAKWSESVKIVNRNRNMTHATIRAHGSGSAKVTGKRADLVIIDDIIDPESANSPAERERAWKWMEGALKYTMAGVADARRIIVNTRYHSDDAAGKLKEKYKDADETEFIVLDIPALVEDPETGEEISIWPDRFPTDKLKRERERAYFEFQTHFMNDPIDTTKSQLQDEWLHYIDETEFTKIQHECEYFAGVDPNTDTKSLKKDFFAVVIVGVHGKSKRIFLVDMLYTKADLKTVKAQFRAKMEKWNPVKISLEANAAQGLYETILNDKEHLNYPFERVFSTLEKEQRILNMANHFIAGRVRTLGERDDHGRWRTINSLEPLRREWLTFPQSKDSHFDALDALTLAIRPIVSFSNTFAVAAISPTDFQARVKIEKTLRDDKLAGKDLEEAIDDKLRSLNILAQLPIDPDDEALVENDEWMEEDLAANITEHCILCNVKTEIEKESKMCHTCSIDELENQWLDSFKPKTFFGTIGERRF